jgi:hypothetical protein
MSNWYGNQKKPSRNFRKLLKERLGKANPSRTLTLEEARVIWFSQPKLQYDLDRMQSPLCFLDTVTMS